MTDPIIREGLIEQEEGRPHKLVVTGGLHYLRGNSAPFFSLTCWETGPGGYESGGADHETILDEYPELADLAALHLSDIDGEPMHAEENGWYWLAGALGGLGERFHGSNNSSGTSEAECLATFARHCRISEREAMAIRSAVTRAYGEPDEEEGGMERRRQRAREEWGSIMEEMRPRWKQEADAAIEKHGLVVYGDPWTPEEVRA